MQVLSVTVLTRFWQTFGSMAVVMRIEQFAQVIIEHDLGCLYVGESGESEHLLLQLLHQIIYSMSETDSSEPLIGTISTKYKSFMWRATHGVFYLIGGLTFPLGSISYFPAFAKVVDSGNLGGWLFTVGSFAFLVADMMEWNHYRPACCHSSIESLDYKIGFNFMLSMLGSLMYLLGSIFFLPATNSLELGEGFFTVGSAVIALSQAWKCYRTCVTPPDRPKMDNIREDTAGFLVDLFAGLGGLFYMIGTIIFATAETMDDATYVPSIVFFTLGGLGFMSSALAMQNRYFF